MTEEEAKTKWRPTAGPSRFSRQDELCIGSACMAWRRLGWLPVDLVRAVRAEKGLSFDEAVAQVREQVGREEGELGYCGLAGAPQ